MDEDTKPKTTIASGARERVMTEKGAAFHVEYQIGHFRNKRNELLKEIRSVVLLRGKCEVLDTWKQEFSRIQVLCGEFNVLYSDLLDSVSSEAREKIENIWQQFQDEWIKSEALISSEINELSLRERAMSVKTSVSSRSSRKSRSSAQSQKTKSSAMSLAQQEEFELKKAEAVLKTQLAFSSRESQLKILKLKQEEEMNRLRLEKELAENRAKLDICIETGRSGESLFSDRLKSLATSDKRVEIERFINSQTIENNNSPQTNMQDVEKGVYPVDIGAGLDLTKLNPDVKPFQPLSGDVHQSLGVSSAPELPFYSPASNSNEWNQVAFTLEKCFGQLVETNRHLVSVSTQNCEANNRLAVSAQLPKITVPVFTGDPLQYPVWQRAFTALVDAKPLDASTKLNFLGQFIAGKPKRVVEQFLLLGTEDAYSKAKMLLHERYGNCNVISTAFIKKLDEWPRMGPKDIHSLRDFSDLLSQVLVARQTIPSLAILDFAQENAKLVSKLPYHAEGKWRDIIRQWRTDKGEDSYPLFSRFVSFVNSLSDKANIPELECLSSQRDRFTQNKGTPYKPIKNGNSLATTVNGSKNQKPLSHSADKEKALNFDSCLHCGNDHLLEDCSDFIKKSFKERRALFHRKGLCLGCAQSNAHKIRECPNKKVCKICSGKHITCLHKYEPNIQSAVSNCTDICELTGQEGGLDHSMIIPVWVRPENDPSQAILQYALLDDQSNVSFISENVCDRIGLSGPSTELLLSTMQEQNVRIDCRKISGIEVLDLDQRECVKLPTLFTRDFIPANRSQIPKPEVAKEWQHLRPLTEKLMPYKDDVEVSILIGNNCPRAIRPREILCGGEDEPYGQRSLLGWGIVGRVCKSATQNRSPIGICNAVALRQHPFHLSNETKGKEIVSPSQIVKTLESDFTEKNTTEKAYSIEDQRFLKILSDEIVQLDNGHDEMPLPLKSHNAVLPYNRDMAVKRAHQLKARFRKNPQFFKDYVDFMEDVLVDCAEMVPVERLNVQDGRINYIPHTGVYHPRKPGKIRVVFDYSAKFEGVSLNDHLLTGPDLTNTLLGVLCRFRKEPVAFLADVKGMFHQFMVAEKHRDLLRFLWWENNDPSKEFRDFRMKVHVFGAGSSPGCANYALKRAADDGEAEFGSDAADFIRNDFYVDDGLKSVSTVDGAIRLIKNSQAICAKAGLRLHKIISNSKEVLAALPTEDRAATVKTIDLNSDSLPIERALGVVWCVENDSLQFRIEFHDNPGTRRGILSTVGSIFDPIGFVAPVVLKGKQILQRMCRDNLDWDSPIPQDLKPAWEKWRTEVIQLCNLRIPRCFRPKHVNEVISAELHHFSDASETGYGQCSFLRLVNVDGQAHSSFVIGKARVTPLKHQSIPRLELAAATVSANMSLFLRRELAIPDLTEFFWTDSKVVLGYIRNESKRFQVYVANRVQQIRNSTNPDQWSYIDTSQNPADDASRGLTAKQLLQASRWLHGPEFLHEPGPFEIKMVDTYLVDEEDPELKKTSVLSTQARDEGRCFPDYLESSRFQSVSNFQRLKRVVAICIKYVNKLRVRCQRSGTTPSVPHLSLASIDTEGELAEAERVIFLNVQKEAFHEELKILKGDEFKKDPQNRQSLVERKKRLKSSSTLVRLDPFLNRDGLIRVGGRIRHSLEDFKVKHPIVVPRCHIGTLLIRYFHGKVQHMGRGMTHNEIRQRGYWLIGGSSTVSRIISACVVCRRSRGKYQIPKMADLPPDRVTPSPPFSYSGVDLFGPYIIKEKRSEVKRYGILFTCQASRAVHLEASASLTTSSFINALSRFISRRGAVTQLRCDQGSNFVGAQRELRKAVSELDQVKIQHYLTEHGCQWIPFAFIPPSASHMGGVWERQIQTVKRVLEQLLKHHGCQLNDETFQTFLAEVENIVNSRPITALNCSDPHAPEPLTPSHLLTMKPKVTLPPPGQFLKEDMYHTKWWRRVQYMANQFWLRWRREFLQSLQPRTKWTKERPNLEVGDVVIVDDADRPRNQWPLAKVLGVMTSQDGFVRQVKLLMGDSNLDNRGKRNKKETILDRPAHKVILLVKAEDYARQDEA